MRPALWVLVLAACGPAPKPGRVAADAVHPVGTVAEIADHWVSSENLDWHMNIDADVPIDATISGFTGAHLTISVGDERRDYERASTTSDDHEQPAALRTR